MNTTDNINMGPSGLDQTIDVNMDPIASRLDRVIISILYPSGLD